MYVFLHPECSVEQHPLAVAKSRPRGRTRKSELVNNNNTFLAPLRLPHPMERGVVPNHIPTAWVHVNSAELAERLTCGRDQAYRWAGSVTAGKRVFAVEPDWSRYDCNTGFV